MAALAATHAEAAAALPPSRRLCCMARLTSKAPVQVQKTCSCCCIACVARDEAAACCQPHGHAVPRFMGHPWPPAPTTPCWSRRHHTSFQLLSPGSLHTWRTRAGSAFAMARDVGRGSSCSWVRVARVIAESAHYCKASYWLFG